jgi:hypothetical protein
LASELQGGEDAGSKQQLRSVETAALNDPGRPRITYYGTASLELFIAAGQICNFTACQQSFPVSQVLCQEIN